MKNIVEAMLNTRHALKAGMLLFKFPSAIPELITGGFSAASNRIDITVKQAYARKPIELKHVHGFDIYLDPQNGYVSPYVAMANSYEMGTTGLFLTLAKRGDTIVDVGANLGWYTLLGASKVGRKGTVLSFEPEPTNFALLSRSVAHNDFTNVKLFEKVVSDVDGKQVLHLPTSEGSAHLPSIIRNFGGQEMEVASTRLDTAAKESDVDRIGLLKVDAEGAEPLVLRGAERLLEERKISNIILEWRPEVWIGKDDLKQQLLESYVCHEILSLSSKVIKKLRSGAMPSYEVNLYFELVR